MFKTDPNTRTGKILAALIVPGYLVFFFMIYLLDPTDHRPDLSVWLVLFYVIISIIQVNIYFHS